MKYTAEQLDQINHAIPIVEYASQYLDLKQGTGKRQNEYWAICPFHKGDLNPSLSFNSEKNVFKCLACNTRGGLINFIMAFHKKTFIEAIDYILQISKIPLEEKEYSEVINYLYQVNRRSIKNEEIVREYLSDDIMKQYAKEPIIEWINEGITQEILDKYEVRYDKKKNTIVFPIRDYNGKIIAVKARTLYQNYADLGIPKYKYYQYIITNNFLFGLYQNYKAIKNKNEVIIFEGAKSVLLAESNGINNCVSLETDNINKDQIELLLSLHCDLVFALDKGIKITNKPNIKPNGNNIYVNIGLLPKFTNVYVVEDRNNLVPLKASPIDKGKEIFDKLYEGKYKI